MVDARDGSIRQHSRAGIHARLALGVTASLLALTAAGCSYANATGATRPSDAVLRAADSVRTQSSVDLGYTTQPRGSITGAVASRSFSGPGRQAFTRSLFDLLQGRFAGLDVAQTVGGSVSMHIRGAGGGLSAANPLVVVDGNPLPDGVALQSLLTGIDAQDVIRVDVLKDVSSTAIYGTRGSNGVVLITLRHKVRE
ncbi:MAG: TonB-dependent receptor plug domain-containing protein [Gemmatimonadaceae bacterium]